MELAEILAAFRWWAVLTGLGLLALPACYVLFQRLPDRGYAFTKMAGLLGASYFFWTATNLGFSANNSGGIALGLLILGALAIWLYWRNRQEGPSLSSWLGAHWRQIAVTEILFAVVFVLWVWVRAQNPAITATEKPMEFAFLNAVGQSDSFPPLDPWLSGFAISYYHFGYIMTSLLARLALVPETIAFNLAIAWLVAGTATGAYGLAYNLIAANGRRRNAFLFGILAALAIPIAGNLQIGLELLHGNGVGSPAVWQWLDIRDINDPPTAEGPPRYEGSSWWWWRSSRVIHEYHLSGRPEEGLEPIVEAPSFSFVLGDLHPHVLALPFAMLSLAMALAWWMNGRSGRGALDEDEWQSLGWGSRLRRLLDQISLPVWLATAIVLGGLSFLNTWDVLIHLFVVLGAFLLAGAYQHGWRRSLLVQTIAVAGLIIVPAILLYLPFYLGFRSQTAPPFLLPMLMQPTRLVQFLVIFGMALLPLTIWLGALVIRQSFRYWQRGLAAAGLLLITLFGLMLVLAWIVASGAAGGGQFTTLASELGITLAPRPDSAFAPLWGASAVMRLLPAILVARVTLAGLTVLLLSFVAMCVMVWSEGIANATSANSTSRMGVTLPFALLLVLTATLLTLGPEFVYLRDNFGMRLNTMFKFYYQAWILFGVSAVYALDSMLAMGQERGRRIGAVLVTGSYVALLGIALLFPFFAVRSRSIEYRGPFAATDGTALERTPATLNGLAYMERFNPSEYEAIMWLRDQADQAGAPPVLLEAVGGQYSNYGRVSANTGLPTLLGWPGHQWQWRGSDHPEPGRREPIVEQIYTTPDLDIVAFLLDEFEVNYIYVGDLERSTYGPVGLEKFRDQLDVAFENDGVTIYRWQAPDRRS